MVKIAHIVDPEGIETARPEKGRLAPSDAPGFAVALTREMLEQAA